MRSVLLLQSVRVFSVACGYKIIQWVNVDTQLPSILYLGELELILFKACSVVCLCVCVHKHYSLVSRIFNGLLEKV